MELGHWRGEEGGVRRAALLPASGVRVCVGGTQCFPPPPPPPPGASPAEGAFGGLSNCLREPLPLPAAVTARFLPSRRALRRRARAGAERAVVTLRNGTGRANQEIHFRVAQAPFCESGYKGGPAPSHPFSCCWERVGWVCSASASQLSHADSLPREARPAAAATARGGRGSC